MLIPDHGVVVAGRYTLDRPLARGGMGSVWIAHHRELEIDVTVKFMAPALVDSAEMRTRFEREAKVAARLRSQHVVQVLDYGVGDGMPFIVMELLKGESLADRLARVGRLALPAASLLLGQICKALRTAHEAGLVHRDLKPGNIFLAVKDEEEVVKVLDFGIAKVADATDDATANTATGVMMGSVHYMSPEQIRSSRQVDHRSDLWSVGVILYKVLTGNLPFPGTTQGDVMVRVCTDTCPPPSFVAPDLPKTVDEFFVKALTRELAGRFQSAQEMVDAFVAASGGYAAPIASQRPAPRLGLTGTMPLSAYEAMQSGQQGGGGFVAVPRPAMLSVSELEQAFQRGEVASANATPGAWGPRTETAVPASGDTGAGTFQAVVTGRQVETSQRMVPASAARSRIWLPVGVAAGVVVLGGISLAVIALRGTSPDSEARAAAGSGEVQVSAAVSASATTAVPTASASPAASVPIGNNSTPLSMGKSTPSSRATATPRASQYGGAPMPTSGATKSTTNPLDRAD